MSNETTPDRLTEIEQRLAAVGRTAVGTKSFVVHAPTDLAALVAVVKALRAARRDLSHHHAHAVPARWDKDGSVCDVCVRVNAMDTALSKLEEN